jgi:DNA modification methylase
MTEAPQVLPDIKPVTPATTLDRTVFKEVTARFPVDQVARAVGLSPTFIRRVCQGRDFLNAQDVLTLLDQDAYGETLVPRSQVLTYLMRVVADSRASYDLLREPFALFQGHAVDILRNFPSGSIQTVVTSTPYWGTRIYKDSHFATWADGEICPYGHEQTPEAFARHTAEVLEALWNALSDQGSIWWNVMDTFNTRTQIRGNAAEALRAMQGKDKRAWADHDCRRYSAGHAYLKDGEQCLIPMMIAERASRMGFYVKSVITWAKQHSLPEPQPSRVSRNLEYILHLTKVRTPHFEKSIYRTHPADLGGRNNGFEADKLGDVWTLAPSAGRDGHGAQFPVSLPARCIALSSNPGDIVLDPFVGSGNAGIAALALGRRFVGVDVSPDYLTLAKERLGSAQPNLVLRSEVPGQPIQDQLGFI